MDPKHVFDPILKMVLKSEKEDFNSKMETWSQREEKITAEFEQISEKYYNRLMRGCELVKEHFESQTLKKNSG